MTVLLPPQPHSVGGVKVLGLGLRLYSQPAGFPHPHSLTHFTHTLTHSHTSLTPSLTHTPRSLVSLPHSYASLAGSRNPHSLTHLTHTPLTALPPLPHSVQGMRVLVSAPSPTHPRTSRTLSRERRPQEALCGGIPCPFLEPLARSWSHCVGIYRQKSKKSSKNDF